MVMDIASLAGHLAFGLIAFSFLVKDILWLRVVSILASLFSVFYNYTSAFSVDVVVTDASCLCCNDGAINFTISGGYPPYEINDIGEQNNLAVGEEKIILVRLFFLHNLKSLTAFVVLLSRYFSGKFTDSSTCINPAKCIKISN